MLNKYIFPQIGTVCVKKTIELLSASMHEENIGLFELDKSELSEVKLSSKRHKIITSSSYNCKLILNINEASTGLCIRNKAINISI